MESCRNVCTARVYSQGVSSADFQDDYSLRGSSNNGNTVIAMYSPKYVN